MSVVPILLEIRDWLPFLYSLLFVVSIGVFKKHTSLSLIVVLLALFEFISNAITLPLLDIMNDKSIDYVIRLSAWVGFWVLSNRLIIELLQRAHEWLNITKGKELVMVQGAYIGLISLLAIDFINQITFKTIVIDVLYRFGIPTINLSIAGYLLFAMLKHMEFKKWKAQA